MFDSPNLTSKWEFAQNFNPNSDRILKKVPYILKNVFDTLNVIPEFPVQ